MHKRPVADCFTWADQPSCIHSHGRKERKMRNRLVFWTLQLISYVCVSQMSGWQVHKSAVFWKRLLDLLCASPHLFFLLSVAPCSLELALCLCDGSSHWFFSGIIHAMHQLIIFPSCTLLHLLMMGKYGRSLMSYAFQWSTCQEPRPCPLNIAHRLGPILLGSRALNWIFSPTQELHSSAVSRRVTPLVSVRDSHYWPPSHPVLLKKNHVENPQYQCIWDSSWLKL